MKCETCGKEKLPLLTETTSQPGGQVQCPDCGPKEDE